MREGERDLRLWAAKRRRGALERVVNALSEPTKSRWDSNGGEAKALAAWCVEGQGRCGASAALFEGLQ